MVDARPSSEGPRRECETLTARGSSELGWDLSGGRGSIGSFMEITVGMRVAIDRTYMGMDLRQGDIGVVQLDANGRHCPVSPAVCISRTGKSYYFLASTLKILDTPIPGICRGAETL